MINHILNILYVDLFEGTYMVIMFLILLKIKIEILSRNEFVSKIDKTKPHG